MIIIFYKYNKLINKKDWQRNEGKIKIFSTNLEVVFLLGQIIILYDYVDTFSTRYNYSGFMRKIYSFISGRKLGE